nr:hypothetical protein [Candidatus Sigynarchaeum springense]
MYQFFMYEYQWMAYAGAIISSAIGLVVFALLAKKCKERPVRTVRSLRDMAGFLVIAAVIDYVAFTLNGVYPGWRPVFNYVTLGSYLSFTMNAIANIFLLLFIRDVFFEDKNKKPLGLLAAMEIAVGPALVIIFFTGDPDWPLLALAVHVASAMAIYIVLTRNAIVLRGRIKRDSSKQVEAHGLAYIALSGLFMLAALILFVSHEAIILVPIREYWTVTLGWILGAVGGVVVYLGFTPPEWLKARWASQVPARKEKIVPDRAYS